jgi:signal transduction histidine kinase
MTSFLGVPIIVRGEVFGNLYLTDKSSAEAFSDLDEQLATGLASAAGIVIENARLYGQVRRREAALAAVHEIMKGAVAGSSGRATLQLIADRARQLVGADAATFARPAGSAGMLVIDVASGSGAADLVGQLFPAAGSVSGTVIDSGGPLVLTDASHDGRVAQPQVSSGRLGPGIWVALTAFGQRVGTLAVARAVGAQPFSGAELEFVELFATQAGLVLELDRSREDLLRLSVLEDQERIARDLHDTVIQRLFATGLSLQSASRLADNETVRTRMTTAVDDLDATVRHIRTVIFGLERQTMSAPADVRRRTLDLTAEATRALGFEPQVTFDGPLDTMVSTALADEVLAVLREALSNVGRHAAARHVLVELVLAHGELSLTVTDDGVGLGADASTGGHGVANMRARATDLGGTLHVTPGAEGRGVRVRWSVPV